MRGGKRDGAGRRAGSSKGRVKVGITLARENADWLREKVSEGFILSALLDKAVERMRWEEAAGRMQAALDRREECDEDEHG